jgi:hypothetical protein
MNKFHSRHDSGGGNDPAKVYGFGQYVLTPDAIRRGYKLLAPNKQGAVTVTPLGKPVVNAAGQVENIEPFLKPTEHASTSTGCADGGILGQPSTGQYYSLSFVNLPIASFIGSKRLPNKNSEKVTLIDMHPDGDIQAGEATCLQSLIREASEVLVEHPEWKATGCYIPSDDYNSGLKKGTVKGLMTCMCWGHPNEKNKATPATPIPGIMEFSTSTVKSVAELIFREDHNYMYPENMDEWMALASREEQLKRFVHGDFCNPAGVPGFSVYKLNPAVANSPYVVNLTQERYQVTYQHAAQYFLEPEQLYYFLTFEETYTELLRHAMGDQEWFNFLIACGMRIPRLVEIAKSTPFIPKQPQGGGGYQHATVTSAMPPSYGQMQVPPPPITTPVMAAPSAQAPMQQQHLGGYNQPMQPPMQQPNGFNQPMQRQPNGFNQPMHQPAEYSQPQTQQVQQPMQQQQTQQVQQPMQQQVQQPPQETQQIQQPAPQNTMPAPDNIPPATQVLPADHPQSVADRTAEAKAKLSQLNNS